MEKLPAKANVEDVEAIYLEAHEITESVEQVNNALDALDPLLDTLNHQLDLQKIKRTRIRNKLNQIMTKL